MRLIDAHKLSVDMEEKVFCSNGGTQFIFGYSYAQVHSLPTIDLPAIALPPNDPLTLEQLREMDGEPVWVIQPDDVLPPFWGIVNANDGTVSNSRYCATFEDYDTEWLAYRRRPKEVTP